jgi:hypothetical protein
MNETVVIVFLIVLVLLLAGILFFAYGIYRAKTYELKRQSSNKELKISVLKLIVPLKIQACERFLLFLERVQLQVLVKRVFVQGMTRDGFHLALLQNIRDEYEHNLAQQLYVSNATWTAVRDAKEELIRQINTTFDSLADETDAAMLAQSLVVLPNPFVEQAILVVKSDYQKML